MLVLLSLNEDHICVGVGLRMVRCVCNGVNELMGSWFASVPLVLVGVGLMDCSGLSKM